MKPVQPPSQESPVLKKTESGLSLISQLGELRIDFLGDNKYWKHLAGKKELIAKACGLGKGAQTVMDLTSGLGEDAWTLARLGFQVTSFERQPLLHAMLAEAKQKFEESEKKAPDLKVDFRLGDSQQVLKRILADESTERPDVIYYDPMFLIPGRTAKPKKDMQILALLTESAGTAGVGEEKEILQLSLRVATQRVVVKRWIKAPSLSEKFQHQVLGKSIRFDCYQVASHSRSRSSI